MTEPKAPPFLSVVLTTMDRPLLLRSAIDSVLTQSLPDFELIIVDDGAMPETIQQMVHDHRIIYVNKRNFRRGVAASRNIGMDFASGRYLYFLDDDDIMHPDFIAWLKAESQHHDGKAIFGNFFMVQEQIADDRRVEMVRTTHEIAAIDIREIKICNFIPMGAIALPRVTDMPRFDASLPSHEDWDFLLSCLDRFEFIGIDRIACEVRQRALQPGEHRHNSREPLFWLDFLAIYQRHPDPEFARFRAVALKDLGFELSPEILAAIGRR